MGPVTLALCPVGAPGTVMAMEEMIACGAKAFVGLGLAGSLQPQSPIGSLLIPDACVSDEGTSRHYVRSSDELIADPGFLQALQAACAQEGLSHRTGLQWTTDAIYRERVESIEAYREQGVFGVDMETSAMYAIGRTHGVAVCNILAVSDELWREWRPGFHTEDLDAALISAQAVVWQPRM